MARDDIKPVASSVGGGSHAHVETFGMNVGTTQDTEDTSWLRGNWLLVDGSVGDIGPEIDGAILSSAGLIYVAASDSAATIQLWNTATTVATATGVGMQPTYDPSAGGTFSTTLVVTNNDTAITLGTGAARVGATADGWVDDSTATLVGHNHGLDTNVAWYTITRIIDANGIDWYIDTAGTLQDAHFRRII